MAFEHEERGWFFREDAPENARGQKVNLNDTGEPNQDFWERLAASILFKKREDDRAKQTTGTEADDELVGHVQIATDTEAKEWHNGLEECTSKVCHPQQLPEVKSDDQTFVTIPSIENDENSGNFPPGTGVDMETITVTIDETSPESGFRNIFLLRVSEVFDQFLTSLVNNVNTLNQVIYGGNGADGPVLPGDGILGDIININESITEIFESLTIINEFTFGCIEPDFDLYPQTGCPNGVFPKGTLRVLKDGGELTGNTNSESIGKINFIGEYFIGTYTPNNQADIDFTKLDETLTNIFITVYGCDDPDLSGTGPICPPGSNPPAGTLLLERNDAQVQSATVGVLNISGGSSGGTDYVTTDDDGDPNSSKVNLNFQTLINTITGASGAPDPFGLKSDRTIWAASGAGGVGEIPAIDGTMVGLFQYQDAIVDPYNTLFEVQSDSFVQTSAGAYAPNTPATEQSYLYAYKPYRYSNIAHLVVFLDFFVISKVATNTAILSCPNFGDHVFDLIIWPDKLQHIDDGTELGVGTWLGPQQSTGLRGIREYNNLKVTETNFQFDEFLQILQFTTQASRDAVAVHGVVPITPPDEASPQQAKPGIWLRRFNTNPFDGIEGDPNEELFDIEGFNVAFPGDRAQLAWNRIQVQGMLTIYVDNNL